MSGRSWNTIGMNRGGKTLSQNKLFVIVFVWEYDHTQESNTHTQTHMYTSNYIYVYVNIYQHNAFNLLYLLLLYIYIFIICRIMSYHTGNRNSAPGQVGFGSGFDSKVASGTVGGGVLTAERTNSALLCQTMGF